jgi:hypothetical protein
MLKKQTFERTDKFQIETYGKNWYGFCNSLNDCEFVLEKMHPKKYAWEKQSQCNTNNKDKSYTFEYSFVNDDNKQLEL